MWRAGRADFEEELVELTEMLDAEEGEGLRRVLQDDINQTKKVLEIIGRVLPD